MGKEIALLVFALLLGLFLSECALQILHNLKPGFIIKKRAGGNHPADLVRASDKLDYELTPNFRGRDINPQGDFDVSVSTNLYGMRDIDFSRAKDVEMNYIMAVGDSIMYGEGVELEESFLALLEQKLRETVDPSIQMIKAGVPGYSEKQAVDLVEARFGIFKPHIVILGITPTESWRNVTGYRNEQGFVVDSRLDKQYFRFGDELFASNVQNRTLAYFEAWSEAHFILPTFLRQRRKYLTERLSFPPRRPRGAIELSAQPALEQTARKRESNVLDPRFRGDDKEVKISREELLPTIEVLDRFLELARKLEFTPVLLIKGYDEKAGQMISDYAKERSVATLDLAPLFKVGEGKIHYAFPHDGHWNASTHRLVAEMLYNFFVNQKIIQERDKTI